MKKILILSGLSLLAALAVRAQDKVTEYNVRPAVAVRTPIQGDSINFTGEKFTVDDLLKTDISLDFDGRPYERMAADTAGYVRVEKADKDNLFYLFATNLRAERFMKGKLNIYSPARFEVFVNGVSKQSKTTAEDSLSQVSPSVLGLRLEPEPQVKRYLRPELLYKKMHKTKKSLRLTLFLSSYQPFTILFIHQ